MADKKISALTSASLPLAGTEVFPVVQSGSTVKTPVSSVLDQSGTDAKVKTLTASGALAALVTSSTQADIFNGVSRIFAIGPNASTAGRLKLIASSSDASVYFEGLEVKANGDLSLPANNLVQGTAAKGVNFTANTPAAGMTSQLLNWYEEGTWTPAVVSSSGTITSVTGNVGRYTRVGRSITCVFNFTIADNGTGAGALFITGLPFVGNQAVLTYYAVFGWNRGTGMSLAGEYNPGTGGTGRIALYKYDATYPVATGNTCECVVTYEV